MKFLYKIIQDFRELNRVSDKLKILQKYNDREFEILIGELYSNLGYHAYVTQFNNDEGKDVIAIKEEEKVFIECKRFGSNTKVGREIVQKLAGAVKIENANRGIIVTTSTFNKNAHSYLKKNNIIWIEFVNGIQLVSLIDNINSQIKLNKRVNYNYLDKLQKNDWEVNKSFILNQIKQKLTLSYYEILMIDLLQIKIYPYKITADHIFGFAKYSEFHIRKFKYDFKLNVFSWLKTYYEDELKKFKLNYSYEYKSEILGEKVLVSHCLKDKYNKHLFNDNLSYTIGVTCNIEKIKTEEKEIKILEWNNKVKERYNRMYQKKWCFKKKLIFNINDNRSIIPYVPDKIHVLLYY